MNEKTYYAKHTACQQCGRVCQSIKTRQDISSAAQLLSPACVGGCRHAAGKGDMGTKIGSKGNKSHCHVCASCHGCHRPT